MNFLSDHLKSECRWAASELMGICPRQSGKLLAAVENQSPVIAAHVTTLVKCASCDSCEWESLGQSVRHRLGSLMADLDSIEGKSE